MKQIITLITVLWMLVLVGCGKHQAPDQRVHVYKQHRVKTSPAVSDEWKYFYVISNKNQYFYHESSEYLNPSSYSSFDWQNSKTDPTVATSDSATSEAISEQTVPAEELGQQMVEALDTTDQQVNDMVSEGNPNNQESSEAPASEPASEASSTDSNSSDSGSSDSGGSSGD